MGEQSERCGSKIFSRRSLLEEVGMQRIFQVINLK